MPAYFFHLKLELYPAPAHSSKMRRLAAEHASTTFLPPPGSDIFKSSLPGHRTSKWNSYSFLKRPDTPDSHSGSEKTASPNKAAANDRADTHGDALLLPERSLNLRDVPASPALTPARLSNEATARDWRYDAVSIESIDMEAHSAGSPAAGGERGKAVTQGKGAASGLHTKAVYLPSDPKITEVGWGVVHLYRDTEESAVLDDNAHPRKSLDRSRTGDGKLQDQTFDPDDCTTLCILAVPSWMMPSDLLGFVGDQTREDVSHFRLIRTTRANKYMVLMKFRSAKKAKEWQKAWNGRLFNAMEPENCHVVFIKSVEFLTPDSDLGDASSFPRNTNDPFTPSAKIGSLAAPTNGDGSSRTSKSLSSKPLAPPTPNLLELPTCPVCLERMDETTGLLTILCQHVFHCACLEKWRGSGCPVCRYTQSPSFTFPYPRPLHEEEQDVEPMCAVCASTSNLWICLICGAIGCGRYDSAHAYAHYEATSHCYAMDISTQHVWDYAGDGYVHRLIQNKTDSKLIDLPSRHPNNAFRAEGGDSVPREKMENMANEYTYLLTSQLDGQRRYFEEQVERAVDKASKANASAEATAAKIESIASELRESVDTKSRFEKALEASEKRADKFEKRAANFEKLARDMSNQLREEKTMTEGLLKRVKVAEEQAENAKAESAKAVEEKKELEDMCHDLQMFISSAEKVKELQAQGEEVVDGNVSVPEQRKKGKGRKK